MQLSPEIHAAITLQGELLVSFMETGLPEIEARELAATAIDMFLRSSVANPETKKAYAAL